MKLNLYWISSVMGGMLFFLLSFQATSQDFIVAKDGTGTHTTVQAAIDAAPTGRSTPFRIYIKNGTYKEKINIPNTKPFIHLVGESVANVILTYDDYSGKPMPGGGVFGTSNSASVTVRAADFMAVNITFENSTGESPQALALYIDGDRAAFRNCRFLGGQDTLYAGGNGARQYYRNCYIDGTVDFIFGDARAVFDSCVIYAKTRSVAGTSYITAANTKATEPYGYVFRDSKLPANQGGTAYFFGRPWQNDNATAAGSKSHNKTIFLNTTTSSNIRSEGWSTWDAGTDVSLITYAEYRTKKFDSTLVDVSQRASWSKQLTDAEAAVYYNNATLFGSWDPCAVATDICAAIPEPIAVSNFRGVKGASTSTFSWNISWPKTGILYELLRSDDGTNFTVINQQTAANDSTVNFGYSEAVPSPGQTFYYLVRASLAGFDAHITDTVVISSKPTIHVTGSLGSFLQGLGTPSAPQSYTVAAASLVNPLEIDAPAGYELSTNSITWNVGGNPLVFTPDAFGNINNTTIYVRLNSTTVGAATGDILHTSTGADTVRQPINGNVQSEPLAVSELLQWWPMTISDVDSAAVRSAGLAVSSPTFYNLYISNGTTVPAVPAYSTLHGQAFGATPNGDGSWGTAAGGPGGTIRRTYYQQFQIIATNSHSVRVDSFLLNTSFYNTSSNTRLAVVYSLSDFATDSADVTGGVGPAGTLPSTGNGSFANPVPVNNETQGNTSRYRFALNGASGVLLAEGDTLTIRLYFSCGSSSPGRYAKIKDVQVKGLATNTLPVKLVSFNAVPENEQVKLLWQTANEINAAHFEIERSTDGRSFTAITKTQAINAINGAEYKAYDNQPAPGISYYRLKMVDKDGTFSYSHIVTVNLLAKGEILAYPNPASNVLNIRYAGSRAGGIIEIISLQGKRVMQVKIAANSSVTPINISGLQPGKYWVRINSDTQQTLSFIRQ